MDSNSIFPTGLLQDIMCVFAIFFMTLLVSCDGFLFILTFPSYSYDSTGCYWSPLYMNFLAAVPFHLFLFILFSWFQQLLLMGFACRVSCAAQNHLLGPRLLLFAGGRQAGPGRAAVQLCPEPGQPPPCVMRRAVASRSTTSLFLCFKILLGHV